MKILSVFLFLITCIFNVFGTNMKLIKGDVLIIPMPSISAMYRSAGLARGLKESGYNVTLILPAGKTKKPFLEEFELDYIISEGMTEAFKTAAEVRSTLIASAFSGSKFGWIAALKTERVCYFLGNDEKLFRVLQERKFKIAVIYMEFVNLCASVIPYKLDIPFIHQYMLPLEAGILVHPAVYPVNLLFPLTQEMTYLQRLGNTLFYAMYLLKPDLFNPSDVMGIFAPEKQHISNKELNEKTELYLLDYDELIGHHLPLYPNMIPVGGLATRPPRPLPDQLKTFMDSAQNGVVIVSLGSVIKWVPREVEEAMIGSFKSFPEHKFVFKFGNGTYRDGNVLFASWIPQNDLLGHSKTKLFITHCGHNAQYALYNAVLIIALPVCGDQHYNAVTMQAKGFGIMLDIVHLTETDFISALDKILRNSSYKENISKASTIFKSRPFPPAQRAAWWIDHVIKFGGKHLQPPVARLPNYQFLLLDVILGAVLLFVILGLSCYSGCRCLFRVFKSRKQKKD